MAKEIFVIREFEGGTDTPILISIKTVEVEVDPTELALREAQTAYDVAAQAVEDATTPERVIEAYKALARAQTALMRAEGRLPAES